MDLYAENILDHYKHPRHKGALGSPTVEHGERNISCGDQVHAQLHIVNDTITNIQWTGDGCAISQAAMSMLSEELIGKFVTDAKAMNAQAILALLGVPVGTRRIKCALLGLHTLQNALHTYKAEALQTWPETVGNDQITV